MFLFYTSLYFKTNFNFSAWITANNFKVKVIHEFKVIIDFLSKYRFYIDDYFFSLIQT